MNPPREITPEEAKLFSDHFRSEGIVKRMINDGLWVVKEQKEVKSC